MALCWGLGVYGWGARGWGIVGLVDALRRFKV